MSVTTATPAVGAEAAVTPALVKEETPFQRLAIDFAQSKLAVVGLVLMLLIALIAIIAPLIAPQEPLRPGAARHHGRAVAAGFGLGGGVEVLVGDGRPGAGHALGDHVWAADQRCSWGPGRR